MDNASALPSPRFEMLSFSVGGLVAATTCSFFHHRCEYGMVPPSRHSDKTTPDKTTQLQKKYCIENSLSFTTTFNNIAYFRSEVAYYRQLFCSFVFPSSRISAMDLSCLRRWSS